MSDIKCPYCEKEIDVMTDDMQSSICPKCTSRLVVCESCENVNFEEAHYCNQCGNELSVVDSRYLNAQKSGSSLSKVTVGVSTKPIFFYNDDFVIGTRSNDTDNFTPTIFLPMAVNKILLSDGFRIILVYMTDVSKGGLWQNDNMTDVRLLDVSVVLGSGMRLLPDNNHVVVFNTQTRKLLRFPISYFFTKERMMRLKRILAKPEELPEDFQLFSGEYEKIRLVNNVLVCVDRDRRLYEVGVDGLVHLKNIEIDPQNDFDKLNVVRNGDDLACRIGKNLFVFNKSRKCVATQQFERDFDKFSFMLTEGNALSVICCGADHKLFDEYDRELLSNPYASFLDIISWGRECADVTTVSTDGLRSGNMAGFKGETINPPRFCEYHDDSILFASNKYLIVVAHVINTPKVYPKIYVNSGRAVKEGPFCEIDNAAKINSAIPYCGNIFFVTTNEKGELYVHLFKV